jgi:hypothetical protein
MTIGKPQLPAAGHRSVQASCPQRGYVYCRTAASRRGRNDPPELARAGHRDRCEVAGQPPQLAPPGESRVERRELRVRAQQSRIDRRVDVDEREVGLRVPEVRGDVNHHRPAGGADEVVLLGVSVQESRLRVGPAQVRQPRHDPVGHRDRCGHGGQRADQAKPAELGCELLLPGGRGVELANTENGVPVKMPHGCVARWFRSVNPVCSQARPR